MRVAAVDIGTNTVRLLIADATVWDGQIQLENIRRREVITKLGEGLDASGHLGEAPMQRAIDGLALYAAEIDTADVRLAGGVATAATRSAVNGEEFARRVAATLGFMPRVIDGVEEAQLTFRGATSHLDPRETYGVIDVGGGSTEFVTGRRTPDFATSIDIGSVRLTERIETLQLGTPGEIRDYLDGLFSVVQPPQPPDVVLGSGGTYVTLAALARSVVPEDIERMPGIRLTMAELVDVVDSLATMTADEIADLPSVPAARAGVLRAGVFCAERAVFRMASDTVVISVSDILDGVAMAIASGDWSDSRG